MGLIPHGIERRARTQIATTDIDPEWVAWCTRWRATTTLAPATAEFIYYAVLKAGRWLVQAYPNLRSPDDWIRDVALAYVSAINNCMLGELVSTSGYKGRRSGTPLSARSKVGLLGGLRTFLRDCQEWGWCGRHFDPMQVLAAPRSVSALIGPDPRVLADDVWAKLLWAGLQLQEADLPNSDRVGEHVRRGRFTYPIELVKAAAITWLFAGLRSDELVRLRVGCIRWQQPGGAPGAASAHTPGDKATCLLDVPTHKTGASFTKPVDPL